MTMPRKRAYSIISCFESRTCCRWTDEGHEWRLMPWGSTMCLSCMNIESEADVGATWQVESVYMSFHGRLNIEVEGGLVLTFELEPCEEAGP